jgi:DNA-binding transcriptional LysR family regulator
MSLPDLDLFQTFLTVARHRSISNAASAMEITQPAVTKKIKRLEQVLQATLINRNTRPLQLTPAGEILLEKAPDLLREVRTLANEISNAGQQGLPVLRLGMPDSLSEIMGAEFIGSMQSLAHNIELKTSISPWLETAFRTRSFDLAVDSPPFTDTGPVELTPLFCDPFVIALPRSMKQKPLTQVIGSENFVGYGRSTKFGADCTAIMGRLGVEKSARFNFDSTQSLLRFVQAGYGWAITSAFCLLQSPAALQDITILPCPQSTPRAFFLLHRPGETDAIAAGAGAKFIRVFRQLTDGPWAQIAPRTAAMIREANADAATAI